jgi:hypothetical protein
MAVTEEQKVNYLKTHLHYELSMVRYTHTGFSTSGNCGRAR